METSKKRSDARPEHQPSQSNGSEPTARPNGGTYSPHPETVKPHESDKAPTRKTDGSHVDGRHKDDKDANEQQVRPSRRK